VGLQAHHQGQQRPPPQVLHRLQALHRQGLLALRLQVRRQLVLRHRLGQRLTLVCFDTTSRQRQRLRWQPG